MQQQQQQQRPGPSRPTCHVAGAGRHLTGAVPARTRARRPGSGSSGGDGGGGSSSARAPAAVGAHHPAAQQQQPHAAWGPWAQQHRGPAALVARAGFGFGAKKGPGGGGGDGKNCPCGSGKLYKECCQPFHKSAVLAPPSPEALVRARYAAFVKRDARFLRATSHPDNPALKGSSTTLADGTSRQCSYEEDLAVTFLSVNFTGLTLLRARLAEDGASASVDIRAAFKRVVDETGKRVPQPQEQAWCERSQLVRDDEGRWLVRSVEELPQQ